MRNIQFQEVIMENFGPYIEPMSLSFSNNQLTLLTGPNGIGKTLALDALPFTLYGITSKKAKGDDVVNNRVQKNCKTCVRFKINDDQYIVTRYHKYTKLGNTVILNKNGVDIRKGHREVVPEIERLVCPQKAFMNTLMFGQKVKDFFTDLVDSDKKEIFRKILGFEKYVTYYKKADEELKGIVKLLDSIQRQIGIDEGLLEDSIIQIKSLEKYQDDFYKRKQDSIDSLNKSLEENKRLLKIWQRKLESIQSDSDTDSTKIIKELSQVESKLAFIQSNYKQELNILHQKKTLKINEVTSEADTQIKYITDNIKSKLDEIRDERLTLQNELTDFISIKQKEIHQVELEIGNIRALNKNIQENINNIIHNVLEQDISSCPTCEQSVTDDVKDNLLAKTENLKSAIGENESKIEELKKRKILLKNERESFKTKTLEKSDKLNSQIEELHKEENNERSKINERLLDVISKIEDIATREGQNILKKTKSDEKELIEREKQLKEEKEKIDKKQQEIDGVKDNIKLSEQEINSIERQIKNKREEEYDETQLNSYIKKKSTLENTLIENKEQTSRLEKQVEIYRFWKTAYSSSGIPSMLIDDAVPFMNEKISEYLEMLTNGRYIVSFDTLDSTKAGEFRDKISVHVIDTETRANSRVQLSGGQTRIIDIATILTLGDLQSSIQDVKFNILLFDEIFDALDTNNTAYVSKVLNKLKIGKSIYVISHQHQDHLEPDNTLSMR